MKKNIGITLGIAAIVGASVIGQSNIDFAALSEESAAKVIESLGSIKSNKVVGNIITDYSNYKKEKEALKKEDYKDYKDDALYIADLETDKAVVERIEKEIKKEKEEEEKKATESEVSEFIGEIPGPRNEQKTEGQLTASISDIPTSSHFSTPSDVKEIPQTNIQHTPSQEVKVQTSRFTELDNDKNISSVSGSETQRKDNTKVLSKEIETEDVEEDLSNKKKTSQEKKTIKEESHSSKESALVSSSSEKKDPKDSSISPSTIEEVDETKPEPSVKKEENPESKASEKEISGENIKYIVKKDVYIREENKNDSKILGTLKKDTVLHGKPDPFWIEIKNEGKEGFVSASYLKKIDEAAAADKEEETESSLELKNETIESFDTKSQLEGKSIKNNELPNMDKFILDAESMSASDREEDKENLKIDEGNFIQYLYKTHLNIELKSNIQELAVSGYAVDKDNLKAGDLIFIKNGDIEEVGLYIGENQFLHGSETDKKVIKSDITSDDYNKTFVTARRIIN